MYNYEVVYIRRKSHWRIFILDKFFANLCTSFAFIFIYRRYKSTVGELVAVRWMFFYSIATGRYLNFPFQPLRWAGKVRITVLHYGSMRTSQVPRNISLFIDITCLMAFFFHNLINLRPRCCYFQSRRYHSTISKFESPLHFYPSFSKATPPTPSPRAYSD